MSLPGTAPRRRFIAAAAALAWAAVPGGGAATPSLDRPGIVVLLRHALAPGIGDPRDFVLEDCATQRNLDERGRRQALAIGDLLRQRGLVGAGVYSSRWCRALETADLLDLGPVQPLPALDSFFARRDRSTAQAAALRDLLARLGPAGPPVVMVTHQVNIGAITGRGTRPGEAVVLRRLADGGLAEVESLSPPA